MEGGKEERSRGKRGKSGKHLGGEGGREEISRARAIPCKSRVRERVRSRQMGHRKKALYSSLG